MNSILIMIPTYNAGELAHPFFELLYKQIEQLKEKFIFNVLIIDSGSKDGTLIEARKYNFNIRNIISSNFNHGSTRNLVLEYKDSSQLFIFLTQDALLEEDALLNIISSFDNKDVVAAYGRQLPHTNANLIAQHARFYNYGGDSYLSNKSSISRMGLKTVFLSNSFSAYRVDTFSSLGGFPDNTILCEDMYFAAKAVLAGYSIAYNSEAKVRHSHNYSFYDEFKRYFDIGVFHCKESWIKENFGGAGGEGKRFIYSEIKFLFKYAPLLIPKAILNNFFKLIGYKLGLKYRMLPTGLVRKFSMHKKYWK